ncbi:hypothetical protein DH2020_008730 [Rehmannia glutinosa]|uniref:CRAL-TRIO domain-containing protein n=1 Tax=Rehmannia glutinosa TaxID=99300 RepID=A0ABR0X792_REHGL
MVFITEEMIKQFETLLEKVDEPLKKTFQNMHNGYQRETLGRFLKARDGNVSNAHKMLMDCLNWRVNNEIDNILAKPINPSDLYRAVRDSQLTGMSGYSKEGLPVIAIGVGRSTYDKASPSATKKFGRYIGTCIKILDMTGLKISALNQMKLLSVISTIDDLNYPEKTETYYIVNAPYIFSACWKVVRPLLQERTRKKVQVLSGSGRDELLKIMDYDSLPHFCRREGSGSSRHSRDGTVSDCFSLDHPYHQQLYNYVKEQASLVRSHAPVRHGSFHMDFPEPDPDVKIIECELQRLGNQNGLSRALHELKVNGD